MYNSSNRGRSYGRNSSSSRTGDRRSSGTSSFRRGSFSNSRGGRGGGRYSRRPKTKAYLDPARYIKKSSPKTLEEYVPQHQFEDFNIENSLKRNIADKKYVIPTPIQDQAIDSILEGKDVIGIANTGTGKTAAFLIPLINKVLKSKKQKVLIMVPTRELANQIYEEFRDFSKFLKVFATTIIGGENIQKQIFRLKRDPHFVIGTPGRLQDLEERGVLDLGEFSNVVLDEVDRMVDMGFIQDMRAILAKLPEERQSLFFSATMSREIESLMKTFLRDPITVSVKTQPTSDNVDQDIIKYNGADDKFDKLTELLGRSEVNKVIIFVKTKIGADKLDNLLYKKGFKCVSLHGDKSQYMRQKSLDKFKKGFADILVATDVAARGLDVPNVSHVINYDLPENFDDYTHRIGRTGRGSKTGVALTFIN